MKTKFLIFTMIISLMTISCSKDNGDTSDNSTITADEAGVNAKIDIASDDVSDVVAGEETATYDNSTSGKFEAVNPTLSPCATVTRVPAFGTVVTPGTTVTKTIDFGTTGCALNNGNIVKGKIIITFVYDPSATSHTITYTFDHFYHNAILIEGHKTFTRTMTAGTPNSPTHPIVTMNMDLSATFPDGRVFTRIGQRVREIIEGYSTPASWTDNIYQVTGSWTTTFPNTTIQTSTITTPIIIKLSCIAVNKPLLVKGIITTVRNAHVATLDFGDGTCDNLAVFTINGVSYNIIIGN